MKIHESVAEQHVLLSLEGSLDATQAALVSAAIERALEKGPPNLVLDLEKLRYVASMGLRCFIMANQSVSRKGGSLLFCGLNDAVRSVFDLAGLLKFFRVVEDRDAARLFFGGGP